MIQIDRTRQRPLSRVLRQSAMVSFSDADARGWLLDLPGELGAVRGGYIWALIHSTSRDAFMSEARAIYEQELRPFAERGALVIAGLAGTPRWLAREPADSTPLEGSGWPTYAARPPRDFGAYAQLASDLVRMANDARIIVEFGNEPGASAFWQGTEAELFQLWALTAEAVHAAGGRILGMANSPPWDGGLERWIRALGQSPARQRPDGISWHIFQSHPTEGAGGVEMVRGWLRAAGLNPELPQVITEWQRWTTWPEKRDPSRDTAVGMAHHAAALASMARSGAYAATVANLAGFGPSNVGDGDFGLLARDADGVLHEKPCWRVQAALAELGAIELGTVVPPELAAAGVGIIATDDEVTPWRRNLRAIVWRYDPDGRETLEVEIGWPGDHQVVKLEPFDMQVLP